MLKDLLLIGTGGFVGSVARYAISLLMSGISCTGSFPVGTFTVNFLGSLLIGVFMSLTSQGGWYYLAVVGFCGGFTTFSTFSTDMLALIRNGCWPVALIYMALSVIICVCAVALGIYLADRIKLF